MTSSIKRFGFTALVAMLLSCVAMMDFGTLEFSLDASKKVLGTEFYRLGIGGLLFGIYGSSALLCFATFCCELTGPYVLADCR